MDEHYLRIWRPLGVRIVGFISGAFLVITLIAVWYSWSKDIRDQFTPFQFATIYVLCGLIFLAWHALVRCRVEARASGLTVVNGYRRHEYEWAQVVSINLPRGAPWASLDLSDGSTAPVLAIQGSDGRRAVEAVRELRSLAQEATGAGD